MLYIAPRSPDRLPHYVRIFNKAVGEQLYRYSDVPHPDGHYSGQGDVSTTTDAASQTGDVQQQPHAGAPPAMTVPAEQAVFVKTTLTDDERKKMHDLTVVNASLKPQYAMVRSCMGYGFLMCIYIYIYIGFF